jgi:hypothetical protein
MLITTDFITPAELTGFARASLADLEVNRFKLSAYLPSVTRDDLDYRFSRGGEGLIEAATYRAFDAESPIGNRPGISRVQGELPPISRKIRLGEYDRLRLRNATDAILNSIQDDTERMTRSVAARVELARGQALADAQVTIAENGVVASVDFGRNPAHSTTAPTAWTDTANSHPLLDLLGWQDTYVLTNGERPGSMLMSSTTFNLLLRSVEFRELAGNVVSGVPALVPATSVTSTLTAYGLPNVVINDEQIRSGGVAVRALPENAVIFLPQNVSDLGLTLWGTTAESLEPDFGLAGADAPGVVAGSYSTKDPVAVWTKAAAIALPIVVNPDLTFKAVVWS